MMQRLMQNLVAIAVIIVAASSFAGGFGWWWALSPAPMQEVYLIYLIATAAALVLCLIGQVMKISSLAYYVIIGGAVYLAVDFMVWQRTGLMPSVKFSRGGFPPAAIMGLFACAFYGILAAPPRRTHYGH